MAWIWLNSDKYPDYQKNFYNVNSTPEYLRNNFNFCVAEFKKHFEFKDEIKKIKLKISADSTYKLFINEKFKGIGPASPGGDFVCYGAYPHHFADNYEIDIASNTIDISSIVKLQPNVLTEYSKGHGGFYCECEFIDIFDNSHKFCTDSTWLSRKLNSYKSISIFDSKDNSKWEYAHETDDIWSVRNSYIPPVSINTIFTNKYSLNPGEEKDFTIELNKIYGIIPIINSSGKCKIEMTLTELEGQDYTNESIAFNKADIYHSFTMHSASLIKLRCKSNDNNCVQIDITLIAPWYPIKKEGYFKCSDPELNKVYEVCKHTLKICRQSIHLDSTKHQEHLACTGDYNIEALMTLFCFDDMRLAEFDLMRTADWLVANKGVMFHTTYSLIFVRMLKDVYMITGNKNLLSYCLPALDALFTAFDNYFGESGVIEHPGDYMFVDWTVIDGYSMHHPPKALGQTVLNAFYYDALKSAKLIYNYVDDDKSSEEYKNKAEKFKICFNNEFYDKNKKLYFDGKTDKHETHHWLPKNSDKIYYSKYPNILACAYGLCDKETAQDILSRIIFNDEMQDIQPYFTHYLLEALKKNDLTDKYALKIFDRWKDVVKDCDKGLAEGWIAPEPNYKFDHSHAWGGTVAYQLPAIISGLKIIEPGMKKVEYNPTLLGLDWAEIHMETPNGPIDLRF